MSEKDGETDQSSIFDIPLVLPVTDVDKGLAKTSYEDFINGRYIECVQSLLKLSANRSSDPKVSHNKSIVEYYLSDFKRSDEFKKNLQHICNQVNVNLEDVDSLDDLEHCVLYYNNAVLLYHLRQYNTAILILDKVFQFIEPLDEYLARKVCFLLLELYVSAYQPEKALGMINFIETMLYEPQTESENSSKSEKSPEKVFGAKMTNEENQQRRDNANDIYRPRLQHYKARCYCMLRSLKGCKRELKNVISSSGMCPTTVYLKANLEYLRGNYRKAIKVLNTASLQSRPFVETGENVPVLFYNNMGCIHFYMGRPNLGSHYFHKALQENEVVVKRVAKPDQGMSGRPVYTIGANVRYELLYNLGIQLLHAKKANQAFDCLIEAVQVFHTNPRLWLRLAECCIQLHQAENEADVKVMDKKNDIIQAVIGNGQHRKFVLAPFIKKRHPISQGMNTSAMPIPTLEFASICLRNALCLLPEYAPSTSGQNFSCSTGDETDSSHNSSSSSNLLFAVPPANPIRAQEIASLKCSVLIASAYVALNVGDVLMALHYAETALAQPKLSGVHRFLANMYAGEALILLDRIADAVQQLNPSNVKDLSFTMAQTGEEKDEKMENNKDLTNLRGWYPNSLSSARMLMQYNLTVAYTVRGELEKANEAIKQLHNSKENGVEIPAQAIMLAVYIQLQLGNAEKAKGIIRQIHPSHTS